ncbi:hypothetical protein NDI56_09665 [Haloarcula sp. S1CR25-12]|uniref:Uncharacterized protein n=1 Tax=Haloarcula saliterrae TaxID=2950534 RepID=A0ABU2FBM0_9EURY|nr:hypothetical protein [Haloarcula sp. S1CR25-12]MDS0259658.1 hypothetical protein [Haloarcula sp. S1CR25-12]
MVPLQIALTTVFAGLAGLLAGVDASRRGRAWLAPALGVGVVALVASVAVLAADGVLLSAYAALNGQALVVSTPRELLALTAAATAVVAGTVLSGYGLLARRRPA